MVQNMTQDGAMPASPDWNVIRELYNKGLPIRNIAEQFGLKVGTIAARASRGNWKRIVTQANAIAQSVQVQVQGKEPDSPESNHLTQASTNVKQSLANALLEATGTLDTLPKSKSLKSRSASAQLLSTLAGVGKTVFGWSESSQSPAVRINVLSTFQVSPSPQEQKPVIDVTPAKAIEPPSEQA